MSKARATLHPGAHIQRVRPIDITVPWTESGRRFTPKPSDPDIQDLVAELIRDGRQLQPCGCRLDSTGNLILIWGFRRWLAISFIVEHQIFPPDHPLSLLDIVIVQSPGGKPLGDLEAYTYTCVENVDREDASPLDKAVMAKNLRDEHGLNAPEIADIIRVSPSHVYKLLRLLDLPLAVQHAFRDGDITMEDAIKLGNDLSALEETDEDVQEPQVPPSASDSSQSSPQVVDPLSSGSSINNLQETPSHQESMNSTPKRKADKTEYKPRSGKLILAELHEWSVPRQGEEEQAPHRILQAMLKYSMGIPSHGPQWLANQIWLEFGHERAPLEE